MENINEHLWKFCIRMIESKTLKRRKMFSAISVHYTNPGQEDLAIDVLKNNTTLCRGQEGFISRDIFISIDDPLKMTTVTSWETKEHLEAWVREAVARDKWAHASTNGNPPIFSDMDIVVCEDYQVP